MKVPFHLSGVLLLCCAPWATAADDFVVRCADRAAVERVYYNHRLGTKPPFDEVLPLITLESLVRKDLHKEAVLKNVYGVEVTLAMVEAEVRRINATTRAPEMLAELKAALDSDPARFARTVARPIVVERTLRARFENDAALHTPARREAERLREALLNARKAGASMDKLLSLLRASTGGSFRETTWQLSPRDRPADESSSRDILSAIPAQPASAKAAGGIYSVEATVQLAQVLSAPDCNRPSHDTKFYLEDLPPDLQSVFRVQLLNPGDVSAVIEMSAGFSVYVLQSRTAEAMMVASSSLGKCDYESWLAGQKMQFNGAEPSTRPADSP